MLQLKWLWPALVLASLFGLVFSCVPGVDTPGVTIPKGDIILEYENPLEILCILNSSHTMASGRNSSHLVFYHNNRPVLPEFVTIVNSTAIRLYVEKPPPSKSMYYCRLKSNDSDNLPLQAVCLNEVIIAQKPSEVTNFTCISYNWENLTCSWNKPENFIATNYSIRIKLPGRAGGRTLYNCPSQLDIWENRCYWNDSTNPHYRQPYETFFFNMTGENKFGNVSFPLKKFHHYTHVIPAPPMKLSIIDKTSDMISVTWTVPFPMQFFPPGITYKLMYQSVWDPRNTWHELKHAKTGVPTHVVNVTGLQYANSLYDIKVYLKSEVAADVPEMWSLPASVTVRTLPAVPASAPKTDVGSFELSGGLPSRDIYIYWQQIPVRFHNGDDFKYMVYKLDEYGHEHAIEHQEMSNSYAKFKGMSFSSHKFVVVSQNKEGRSPNQSVIYIPEHSASPPEPLLFTKIAFGNGSYELSWQAPPNHHHDIVNYTIFSCRNVWDRPYQCTGLLEWVHVPSNVTLTRIVIPEDVVVQFAISANTEYGSSGMVWASCTVIHDKIVGKMKNVYINRITSRTIEVAWKLDCSDRVGMVTGYRISYCPIVEPKSTECKEPFLNTTIEGDSTTGQGLVTGLKPYTTYRVSVAVVTKNGEGLHSDPLMNTTLEAAPDTPPTNVTVTNITDTSFVVNWEPSPVPNGHLRNYYVFYNDKVPVRVDGVQRQLQLKNLSSYTYYTISVEACTVNCSEASQNITIRTGVGLPGIVERLTINSIKSNHSQVSVEWGRPMHSSQDLTVYQLEVTVVEKNGANPLNMTYNTSDTTVLIPIDCQAESAGGREYMFKVRGINVAPENVRYDGPWSKQGSHSCNVAGLSTQIRVVIWICALIAFVVFCLMLGYVGKRVWLRCKMMQDVEVKLPPGLASSGEKDHIHVHSWPMSDDRDPHKTHPSADEELLLHKKCGDGTGGGGDDSSGCSSGHESVSSSLTAGTHMSSDSGTEVDQRAASPDGVFSECCSLRQGEPYVRLGKLGSGSVARSTPNLSELDAEGSGPGLAGTGWSSTGYISMQGSSEDMQAAETGYCRVGLDPLPANKGYVSIATMPTAPSGYVAHSAYVPNTSPHSSPDPYSRMGISTPGYVLPLEGARAGGYVPHGKFDKPEDLYTSVFAPVNSDPHTNSPTTSV